MLNIKTTSAIPNTEADREYLKIHNQINLNEADKKTAIQALEQFVTTYPDYAIAYNNLAILYCEEGDNDKALQYYEKAYELAPNDVVIQKNLADFYFAVVCRPFDAMDLYLKILRSNPEDVSTLLVIGNICALIENFEDARFFYDKVLEIEPWNITAMDNLDTVAELEKIVASKSKQ